ncbi:unnamed protein product [Mytilus coruscus]|uniref:Uncharacterized protein n=1 Tax=Mytilus coruscus TaxID=42192 RepID=A0A6J8A9Z5_MYTCO|nr:unnamed protein product [Mytilus coruscus]
MAQIEIFEYPEADTRDRVARKTVMDGTSKKVENILATVAMRNCETKVGDLDYNKYGKKGHTLQPISDFFVDNFIVSLPVDEQYVEEEVPGQKKTNGLCSWQNKKVRKTLDQMGLEKMELKANGIRGTRQTFKIACPNEPIDKVLDALRTGILADHGIRLQDVDITKDFAGSFDRTTLRNHMLTNHGFRMQNRRHNVMDLDDKYAFVDKDDDMEDGEDALDTPPSCEIRKVWVVIALHTWISTTGIRSAAKYTISLCKAWKVHP